MDLNFLRSQTPAPDRRENIRTSLLNELKGVFAEKDFRLSDVEKWYAQKHHSEQLAGSAKMHIHRTFSELVKQHKVVQLADKEGAYFCFPPTKTTH
jgi:hypothetical protein